MATKPKHRFPPLAGIKNNTQTLWGAHHISQEGEVPFSHSGGFPNAWVLKIIPKLYGAHHISQKGEVPFSHSGGFPNAWVLKTIPNR